MCNQDV